MKLSPGLNDPQEARGSEGARREQAAALTAEPEPGKTRGHSAPRPGASRGRRARLARLRAPAAGPAPVPALRPPPQPGPRSPVPAPHLSSARWCTPASSGGPAARPPPRPGGAAAPRAAARLPRAAPSDSRRTRPGNVGGDRSQGEAAAGCPPRGLRASAPPPRRHGPGRAARLLPRPAPRRTRNRPPAAAAVNRQRAALS